MIENTYCYKGFYPTKTINFKTENDPEGVEFQRNNIQNTKLIRA